MQPKFVAAQKMLFKAETQQTFVKWIARFYYFRQFILPLGLCVLLVIAWKLLIDMGSSIYTAH